MKQEINKFRWVREGQFTNWGLIKKDEVVDFEERGIPRDVVTNWVRDGWAELIKPEAEAKPETSQKSKEKEN
ncbi:MAG: hypothetical protein JSW41_01455 [Candidatus Aenigmatarchaeota archaeon]|nr:MAG: hypothetical protein JSW41_01455 [Candidatus Aenigmarchaeota archaeon]